MFTRRRFLQSSASAVVLGSRTFAAQPFRSQPLEVKTGWVDHISVCWVEPQKPRSGTNAVIWLPYLGGRKEYRSEELQHLASVGFLAVSFDPWQHGDRGKETDDEILKRVFGNFRRHMWPILGQTTLDSIRVIDWMLSTFQISRTVHIGGMSMGGDIAVAVAGIDDRIKAVAAIVATPDWLRPGMHDLFQPSELLPPGTADAYAKYFYDRFNPMTHLEAFSSGKAITFECAANDTHVPPEGAMRFKKGLGFKEGQGRSSGKSSLGHGPPRFAETGLLASML